MGRLKFLTARLERVKGYSGETAKTILLVEDDAIIAMSETRELEKLGYRVVRAASGEKAIQIADGQPCFVNLVLMDIDLGEAMDGIEAARRILQRHNIPVIFLSSHVASEIVRRTEEIMNYGYVAKTSPFPVLNAAIRTALELFDMQMQVDNTTMGLQRAGVENNKSTVK